MTSLDSLHLDDHQELSENDQQLISLIKPPSKSLGSSSFSPLIIAILVTLTVVFINSEWVAQKLDNIPYYKFSLLGILFSLTLFYILFLS